MTLVPAHLSTNVVLVLLVLAYMLVNAIAFLAPGLMKGQLSQVYKTRSTRIFVQTESKYYKLRALLLLQFFLFFGLHIFLMFSTDSAEQLEHPSFEEWHVLLKCFCAPLAWFLLQQLFFNWWGALFASRGRISIMNQVYMSIHIVVSPMTMISFLLEMIGIIDVETATFLLSLTFILMQILFIFSGIKIFWGGWSTLLFIFLYLCTLEIAPLVMIYQLLTR